jgi:chromosome segregation protein
VAATAHLGRLSGVTGRRVRCDAEMRIGAVEASGVPLSVAQLSQGARDQLALALRFAIRDLIADQVALPMILDDPFLNWDGERAAAAAAALRREVAGGEQLWLVSHRPELADWGEPVRVRDASG